MRVQEIYAYYEPSGNHRRSCVPQSALGETDLFCQPVHCLTIHAVTGHRCAAVLIAACLMAVVAGAPVAGQTSRPDSLFGDEKHMSSDPAIEATFNRQRTLMVKALAEIVPSRPNVPEFFS